MDDPRLGSAPAHRNKVASGQWLVSSDSPRFTGDSPLATGH